MRVGWVVPARSFELASARYRCFYPAFALDAWGHESQIFDRSEAIDLTALDVLVIVKRLDAGMLTLAARARDAGVAVIVDLCDDIISPGYRGENCDLNLMLMAGLAAGADLLVTTGRPLTERLQHRLPLWTPLVEIPDIAETPALMTAAAAFLNLPTTTSPKTTTRRAAAGLKPLVYVLAHPLWAVRRAVGNTLRHHWSVSARQFASRVLYRVRHPDWLVQRAKRHWRRARWLLALRTNLGRFLYILRHPAWAGRRLVRLTRPLIIPLRSVGGRTLFVLRNPKWGAVKIRRAATRGQAVLGLRRAAGRMMYAFTHPIWSLRKTAHRVARAALVRALWRDGRRSLYAVRHPQWTLGRLSRALLRSALFTALSKMLRRAGLMIRRPKWAIAKLTHAAYGSAWAKPILWLGRRLRGRRRSTIPEPLALGDVAECDTAPMPPVPLAVDTHRASPGRPTVVWFGNHGGPHSNFGMLSLLATMPELRRVSVDHPFELVVISNDERKFDAVIARLGVAARYVPWTPAAVHDELERAAAALLTSGDDQFSRVKSANRAALVLAAGVPVVAPGMAHGALQGLVYDEVEVGLRRCLGDPVAAQAEVLRAQPSVEAHFGIAAIGRGWNKALARAIGTTQRRRRAISDDPILLFLIDLIQDYNILMPVIDVAMRRGLICQVILSEHAARNSKRILEALAERRLIPTMIDSSQASRLDARWLRDSDVLVTAAESSMPAHRIAHGLVNLANRMGRRTVSVQHGFETPGLTFPTPRPVTFASQTIFTWQTPEAAPLVGESDALQRCVGVGRPRMEVHFLRPAVLPPVVGVFENLHWDRYSENYRNSFVDYLCRTAEARPDLTFVVRPHPAGRWFLDKAPKLSPPNITIAFDPENPDMPPIEVFLAELRAVITTPSTVAADACEAGKPVAIVQADLPDLSAYEPLARLQGPEDWLTFLDRAAAGMLEEAGRRFIARVALPGDGAEAIIDHLVASKQMSTYPLAVVTA